MDAVSGLVITGNMGADFPVIGSYLIGIFVLYLYGIQKSANIIVIVSGGFGIGIIRSNRNTGLGSLENAKRSACS